MVRKFLLTPKIGHLPNNVFFISAGPENILDIDIPQGQILQNCIGEFCLWIRVVNPVLRGGINWKPITLCRVVTVK